MRKCIKGFEIQLMDDRTIIVGCYLNPNFFYEYKLFENEFVNVWLLHI